MEPYLHMIYVCMCDGSIVLLANYYVLIHDNWSTKDLTKFYSWILFLKSTLAC